jgi:tetratricopeptide (TPR) repeat protein
MKPRVFLLAITLSVGILPIVYPSVSYPVDLQKAKILNHQGEKLIEQGNYAEALKIFKTMLESCGDHSYCKAAAQFFTGRCYVESAQFETAQPFLDEAEKIFESLDKKNERAMVLLNRGKLDLGKGNYKSAIKYFDQAEQDFLSEKNNKELFSVYNNWAVALTYLCEYNQALDYLNKAEKIIQGSETLAAQAVIKTNLGLLFVKKQEHDKALENFQQALDFYQNSGNSIAMVTILNNIGHVDESRSQYPEALKKHKEALILAQSIGDQAGEALSLNNLGCVKLRMGDYNGAGFDFRKALEKRKQLGIKHFAAETLNNLGLVHLAAGDYSQALEDFQKADEICSAVGSGSCRAWTLHNRAFALKDIGKFKESWSSSEDAVKIASEIGDRRLEATATLRLGNLYEYEGWFDKAIDQYVKAAEIQQNIDDLYFKANTFSDIGNILAREGDCGEAENFYRKALKLKQSIGAPQIEILSKLATFLIEKKRYCGPAQSPEASTDSKSEVPQTAEQCIRLAQQQLQPDQKIDQALLTYAEARLLLEVDPKASLTKFEKLNSIASETGVRKFAFLASAGRGQAYERLEQWDESRKSYKKAVDYAEQIREGLDESARLKFMDGEEALGVKHILPYEGLARVLLRLGRNEDSLQIAEYTKARSFSEALSRRAPDNNADTPREILKKDAELNNRLAGLIKGLEQAQLNHASETAASLEKEIKKLRLEFAKYLDNLRLEYPLFASTKYPQPMPLASTAIKDSEWALTFEVTDSQTLVYLIHGKKLVSASAKQISRQEIQDMVRKFRQPMEIVPGKDTLADKLRSFDFQTGRKLAETLVREAAAYLPESSPVTIIPDGCIAALPFEMLPLEDNGRITDDGTSIGISDAGFFGDRNAISYYQSITALTLARNLSRGQNQGKSLLVMADPVFNVMDARAVTSEPATKYAQKDKEFNSALMEAIEATSMGSFKLERLPLTSELAESLADVFDQEAAVFSGMAASKKTFLERMSSGNEAYEGIVFATHGYFSSDNPVFQEPVLFLTLVPTGTDGFLRMSEVMGLNINSDIVALTACQTGLGRHVSGEGTMGMGRAFQYAGARSALMSLWSVSERASVKLVQNFFQYIRNGDSKRDALEKARKQIRSEGFDHPFYWAAFILFGETD